MRSRILALIATMASVAIGSTNAQAQGPAPSPAAAVASATAEAQPVPADATLPVPPRLTIDKPIADVLGAQSPQDTKDKVLAAIPSLRSANLRALTATSLRAANFSSPESVTCEQLAKIELEVDHEHAAACTAGK